jgi:WS/DGAT/MGAT family acyltransferase
MRPPVQRASAADRAFMAMDTGPVPAQFGVVLELDGHLSRARAREVIAGRVGSVPRLRQRLVSAPLGCGGPLWIDDAGFDIAHHVREVICPPPGDEQQLMDAALAEVMSPLGRAAPLWSVVLFTGLQDDRSALLVVVHHALADGVGGLSILASLADPGGRSEDRTFPQAAPGVRSLFADALARKCQAASGVATSWRLLRSAMSAGGGFRPVPITPCSLMHPTGPRRGVIVVRTRRDDVRAFAHQYGATTNDAVLVAVAAALRQLLEGRGERLDTVVITVPVSGRNAEQAPALGNMVSPLLVPVPTAGAISERLARVAETVRAGKASASGPPPIAVLGWLFRPLARLGGFRWYMSHQHRFHTLVSHLRGPDQPLGFGGLRIAAAVPLGVGEAGNSTLSFEVLTYNGTLSVSAILDPDHVPDGDELGTALDDQFRLMRQRHQSGGPDVAPGEHRCCDGHDDDRGEHHPRVPERQATGDRPL